MLRSVTPWLLVLALAIPAMADDKAKPAGGEKPAPTKPAEGKPAGGEAKPAGGEAKTAAPAPAAATTGATIGKAAPAFAGKDMSGKEWKNADFAGKIVVLEWFNDSCPVCDRHVKAGTVAETMKKFEKDASKIQWVFVNSTNNAETRKAEIEKYVKDNKITTPILMDADGKIGKAFGAKTTPHIFVLDMKGNVAYMGAIDDNKAGDKKEATNYAAQAIEALLKGTTPATTTTEPYGCSVKYKG